MPYVWVDCDCDKESERAERLAEAIDDALKLIREGDQLSAIRVLGRASGDRAARDEEARETELRKLYQDWLKQPSPRPEFLTFAHKRRTATAA